jgi:hypothetical protein
MMPRAKDDLRVYAVGTIGCFALVAGMIIGALVLKLDHKTPKKIIDYTQGVSNGCYVWSDGHAHCGQGRREPMTEADGGECP